MIRLDHIGVAVADLPRLKELFSLLGLDVGHVEDVPDQGVKTHFLKIESGASGSHLELLEPIDPEGTVSKFIKKRGPGIHHLSFSVPAGRLDSLCAEFRAKGFQLIYERPRSGAHGMRINFLHPSTAGGVLIELMEPVK